MLSRRVKTVIVVVAIDNSYSNRITKLLILFFNGYEL